jgi:carboxyl-terminal processing protease
VRLRVRREPSGEGRLVEIARERLTPSSVHAAAMVEDGTGYLRLGAFNERTDTDTAEALERLARNGMRRLVVDLRDNGGGLLDQALMIAMHFLPRGALIASTLGRARATTDFRVPGISAFTELGLSVLVNGSTAAGAEILAGALFKRFSR